MLDIEGKFRTFDLGMEDKFVGSRVWGKVQIDTSDNRGTGAIARA